MCVPYYTFCLEIIDVGDMVILGYLLLLTLRVDKVKINPIVKFLHFTVLAMRSIVPGIEKIFICVEKNLNAIDFLHN